MWQGYFSLGIAPLRRSACRSFKQAIDQHQSAAQIRAGTDSAWPQSRRLDPWSLAAAQRLMPRRTPKPCNRLGIHLPSILPAAPAIAQRTRPSRECCCVHAVSRILSPAPKPPRSRSRTPLSCKPAAFVPRQQRLGVFGRRRLQARHAALRADRAAATQRGSVGHGAISPRS